MSSLNTAVDQPLRKGEHIIALDGLRGVAIIMVLVHHHQLFQQGWMGVDIFFVLSGYLITSGLRISRTQPRFWTRFYTKRAVRILPASLLALCICWVFYRPPLSSLALYVFFLGNVADCVTRIVIPSLAVMWSLAVEEHFYLLHPFAIRYLSRRACLLGLAVILACEPIARLILSSPSNYNYIYFLTPFRLDGLAAGAVLALLLETQTGRARVQRFASLFGLGILAITATLSLSLPGTFHRNTGSRLFDSVGYTLVAFGSAALIAHVLTHPKSVLARLLQLRALAWIGTISYGMYLFHLFIRDGVQAVTGWKLEQTLILSFPLTVLVSWLSFRFYERHLIFFGRNQLAVQDRQKRPALVPRSSQNV